MLLLSSCVDDKHGIDGTIIEIDGEYFKLSNRMGSSYILEPIKFNDNIRIIYSDTIIKKGNKYEMD